MDAINLSADHCLLDGGNCLFSRLNIDSICIHRNLLKKSSHNEAAHHAHTPGRLYSTIDDVVHREET